MKEKKDMNRKRAIRARQRKQRNRRIALVLCVMFAVLAVSVGGTMAWLMDETDSVTNTFTAGDIDITLTESENLDLKMVPGNTITKDPKVTVVAGSEACWLFVKVEKSGNFDRFMTYEMADGWAVYSGADTESVLYYREVSADDAATGVGYPVLKNNQVTVKETVTKSDLEGTNGNQPTLTFTAYAIQKANIDTAADAWAKIHDQTTGA